MAPCGAGELALCFGRDIFMREVCMRAALGAACALCGREKRDMNPAKGDAARAFSGLGAPAPSF
jgi:hypothetical protein